MSRMYHEAASIRIILLSYLVILEGRDIYGEGIFVRKSLTTLFILAACILLLALSGCYEQGGPVPEEKHPAVQRTWTMEDVNAAVTLTREKIPSPAPTGNGTPPEDANYVTYLRCRPAEDTGSISDADAVIVLIPGGQAGQSYMEILCKQAVYMALTQRNKHIEMLVMDRRPNNVEDLTGMNAAMAAHDTQVAIDYYYHGAEIDGHTFAGFNPDMPYLSEFGLELVMKDVNTLITTVVPDPAVRRQKLFLGGHSMGGPYTALYTGWDFDGNPETTDDAGYMNVAGLVGLDTLVQINLDFVTDFNSSTPSTADVAALTDTPATGNEEYYINFLDDVRTGSLTRLIPSSYLLTSEIMAIEELLAMEAVWHPNEESDLLKRIPYSPSAAQTIAILHNRGLDNYLTGIPSIKDFRYTNEVAFACVVDDNFDPMGALQASCGFLSGGAVVKKDFPITQELQDLYPEITGKGTINMNRQFIANDAGPYFQMGTGPLYTWANYDEVGDNADPNFMSTDGSITYTTAQSEISNLQDVALSMFDQSSNGLEWYFTIRQWVDIWAAQESFNTKYGLNYLHRDAITGLPKIEFIGDEGPMAGRTDQLPPAVHVLKGYNHLDALLAAANTPARRPNEVIDPLLDFVLPATP